MVGYDSENRMKNWMIICVLILTSAAAFAQIGHRAPDFTSQDIEGKTVKLADYLGKSPIMIDFWATWCNPCKVELPHLDDIYKKYKDQGLVFLAISEDSPRSASKVKPYVRSRNYTATVLLDPDGQVLRKFFGEDTLPYTVLIDREGKIVRTFTGYVPGQEKEIEKLVEEMVGKTEPKNNP